MDFLELGNYGANLMFGVVTQPDQMRGLDEQEMAERMHRQNLQSGNVLMGLGQGLGALNSIRPLYRKPTMTLAEWDAARASFASR